MKNVVNLIFRGKETLVSKLPISQNSFPLPIKGNGAAYSKSASSNTRWGFNLVQVTKIRYFHTSKRRPVNPLFAVFLKYGGIKALKGATIISGRMTRKLHDKLPEAMRRQLARHKIIYGVTMVSLPFLCYYSYTHYEECPLSGRKRLITFTKEQVVALAEFDYRSVMSQYQNKIVDENSSVFKINQQIIDKLVKGNIDLDVVKETKWTLNVIDDPDVANAFVLPNGQIFVFTGMLKMLNDWEEMAIILGHEMSHAILGHAQEQQSYLAFGELLAVPLLAFIWFFFDDFVAFLIYSIQNYLYPIIFEYGFKLPYSRQLEIEADEVGLLLATKACFDPRWSVLLWEKMAMRESISGEDAEELDYISTHPSNQKRAFNFEQMIPDMLKKREDCNCPCLSQSCNPIDAAHHIRKCIENIRERNAVSQQINGINSTLKRLPDSNDPDRDKKLPKLQKDVNLLEKELERLESEYKILIGSPQAEPEIKDCEKKSSGGLIPEWCCKVIGGLVTSGKIANSIFEEKHEKTEQHTVNIHKSPFSN